jgi:hypothetical protein
MSNSSTEMIIMQVPAQFSRARTSYVPFVTPVEPSLTGRSLLLRGKSQATIPLPAYASVCQHRLGRRRSNIAACVCHWNELWKDRCYNNRPQPTACRMPFACYGFQQDRRDSRTELHAPYRPQVESIETLCNWLPNCSSQELQVVELAS